MKRITEKLVVLSIAVMPLSYLGVSQEFAASLIAGGIFGVRDTTNPDTA